MISYNKIIITKRHCIVSFSPHAVPVQSVHSSTDSFGVNSGFGNNFGTDSLFVDECEVHTTGDTNSNFYLTGDKVPNAFIIVDMACSVFLTNIEIKNVHNGHIYEYVIMYQNLIFFFL